jgi:N-carbamoyl-L-amino-acid hydrolase
MNVRRDALMAFAEFALAVETVARQNGPDGVATVGVVEALPASRNTIPGEVRFTLDYRHPDAEALDRMTRGIDEAASSIGSARGVEIGIERIWNKPPIAFDEQVCRAVQTSASELGLSHRTITSGAGHDAVLTASVVPTAMIFVPCKDGISHNEAESATKEDCAAGANVLLRTVLHLAG